MLIILFAYINFKKIYSGKNQHDSRPVDCTEVPCHAKDLPVSENLCILFNSRSDFSSTMGTICFNLDAVNVGVRVVLTRFHDSPRETNKPESRGGLGVKPSRFGKLENSFTKISLIISGSETTITGDLPKHNL